MDIVGYRKIWLQVHAQTKALKTNGLLWRVSAHVATYCDYWINFRLRRTSQATKTVTWPCSLRVGLRVISMSWPSAVRKVLSLSTCKNVPAIVEAAADLGDMIDVLNRVDAFDREGETVAFLLRQSQEFLDRQITLGEAAGIGHLGGLTVRTRSKRLNVVWETVETREPGPAVTALTNPHSKPRSSRIPALPYYLFKQVKHSESARGGRALRRLLTAHCPPMLSTFTREVFVEMSVPYPGARSY